MPFYHDILGIATVWYSSGVVFCEFTDFFLAGFVFAVGIVGARTVQIVMLYESNLIQSELSV